MLINTPVHHATFKIGDYVTLRPSEKPSRAQESVWQQLELGLVGVICGIGPSSGSSSQLVYVSVPRRGCWFFSRQLQKVASQSLQLPRYNKHDRVRFLRSVSYCPAGTLGTILQLLPPSTSLPPLCVVLIGNNTIIAPCLALKVLPSQVDKD